ncbi:sulfotransferase family protein [Desulfurivibrio dismutans]|uniref:sulfotransferase family protein n=1 Tax=Desulfurivibrio dismutans TaxID=1398908 RepID=UPI0023DBDFD8|nr:sulfotransferase family protein [Desulfurivibrio alkaliphilus]MDF1614765.1 sulfotransferase family protein [Desulfurivibrio alkaliphilus]
MQTAIQKLSRHIRSFRYSWKPFYRHCGLNHSDHPVHASADVPTIDARIAISHQHRFLFVRIPKCANTTILTTLWLCESGTSSDVIETMDPRERKLLLRKPNMMKLFTRPSSLSRNDTREVLKNYCKAVIVRNPHSRLASAYLYKIRKGPTTQRLGLPKNLSFAGFCDYLHDGGLHADIHWMPQSHICPLPPEELNFIGKMENLAEDLPRLTRIVYGRSARIFTRQHHATQANKHLHELYGKYEKQRVAELYAKDFAFFDYDPEKLP